MNINDFVHQFFPNAIRQKNDFPELHDDSFIDECPFCHAKGSLYIGVEEYTIKITCRACTHWSIAELKKARRESEKSREERLKEYEDFVSHWIPRVHFIENARDIVSKFSSHLNGVLDCLVWTKDVDDDTFGVYRELLQKSAILFTRLRDIADKMRKEQDTESKEK